MSFDAYHLTLMFVALITGVISPIVIQVTKFYLNLLRDPKLDRRSSEIINVLKLEEKISTKLESIKNRINADRVYIFEFHNGGHTYTGKGIQKLSETYEVTNKGVSVESVNTQNLPTSLFSSLLLSISREGHFYIKDVKMNDSQAPTFREFISNRGVKSFVGFAIKNIENNLVGILGVDGVLSKLTLTDNDIVELKQDASILAGYLESILKYVQNKE